MTSSILLLGHKSGTVPALIESLTAAGFAVENTANAQTLGRAAFDLVLLDVALEEGEMCRALYERGIRAPILMLNGANGLHVADLLTRVRVLLSATRDSGITALADYSFGEVHVDFLSGSATRNGMPVKLSAKELHLLRYLISWRGSVLSRQELLTAVWRYRAAVTRTLDVHIAGLRQKLEEEPHQPRYIRTVRGKGYTFREAADRSRSAPFAQLPDTAKTNA